MTAHKSRKGGMPEQRRGTFNAFPKFVEQSGAVCGLSDAAYRLLHIAVDLHNGRNNGHIPLTLAALALYGWNSNDKLTRAIRELESAMLLHRTRQGGMGIGPSLFALVWLPISDRAGLDHISTFPLGAWKDDNGAPCTSDKAQNGPIARPSDGANSRRLTVRVRTASRCESPVSAPPHGALTGEKSEAKHRQTVRVVKLPYAPNAETGEGEASSDRPTSVDPSGMIG